MVDVLLFNGSRHDNGFSSLYSKLNDTAGYLVSIYFINGSTKVPETSPTHHSQSKRWPVFSVLAFVILCICSKRLMTRSVSAHFLVWKSQHTLHYRVDIQRGFGPKQALIMFCWTRLTTVSEFTIDLKIKARQLYRRVIFLDGGLSAGLAQGPGVTRLILERQEQEESAESQYDWLIALARTCFFCRSRSSSLINPINMREAAIKVENDR